MLETFLIICPKIAKPKFVYLNLEEIGIVDWFLPAALINSLSSGNLSVTQWGLPASLDKPPECESRSLIVIREFDLNHGKYFVAGSSKFNLPLSTNCMMQIVVKTLDIEAIL